MMCLIWYVGIRREDESCMDVPAVTAAFDCYLLSLVACHVVCKLHLEMYVVFQSAR